MADTQLYFTATMLQAFFYAFYLVSLVHALRWLLYDEEGWTLRSRDKVNWILITISVLVLVFSTADVVLEILLQLTSASGTSTHQLGIASIAMENTTLLITDAVLIIRCWLVYQRSWRIVCFPLMLWLANVALSILWVIVYTMGQGIQDNPVSLFALRLFYCCTCATNLYATSAIVYRLQRVARENSRSSSILYRICRTIATTGILYTFTSLPLVVTAFFFPEYASAYLICDAVNFSMAGITFNLLLIRVGQLRAEVEMDANGSSRDMSESVLFSTMQPDVPALTTTDFSMDAVSADQRSKTDTKRVGSMLAKK